MATPKPSKSLTLTDAQTLREKLEADVKKLLATFTAQTGMGVAALGVTSANKNITDAEGNETGETAREYHVTAHITL